MSDNVVEMLDQLHELREQISAVERPFQEKIGELSLQMAEATDALREEEQLLIERIIRGTLARRASVSGTHLMSVYVREQHREKWDTARVTGALMAAGLDLDEFRTIKVVEPQVYIRTRGGAQ